MEVPRRVTLSPTQGVGNHTPPCFPSQAERFLLFLFLFFLFGSHCLCDSFKAYSVTLRLKRRCWEENKWASGREVKRSRHLEDSEEILAVRVSAEITKWH